MSIPQRIKEYTGRHTIVDGISYTMPIAARNSSAFMAGFFCNYDRARALLPGNELHPFKFFNGKAVFLVTVVNYVHTSIGKYIEYSMALACTRGRKPAPAMIPAMMMNAYGTGQFILDLPVSSEISVKGGKGIWGMPKHRANLDYIVTDTMLSAQYEKDGKFAFRIEIPKPQKAPLPLNFGATNYSHYRNMLTASCIYFKAKAALRIGKAARGALFIGDHPRTSFMRNLEIEGKPFFTLFMPSANGILDDHFQSWFITYDNKPDKVTPEGFESVIDLGLGEDWLPPPAITDYNKFRM